MIYDMICNTLTDLNPNALPLDDVARAEMPNLMELAKKYRRGFVNRYEYLKATCEIMGYNPDRQIKGFFVNAEYDNGNIETLDVFDTEDEAYDYINTMFEYESFAEEYIAPHNYVVEERR